LAAIERLVVALRGADTVQLRISLTPTTLETFVSGVTGTPPAAAAPSPADPSVTTAGAIQATAMTAPSVAANRPPSGTAKPRKPVRPVIVLDPGHGGVDAGTVGASNVAEKDVVLRFGKLLRDKLRASGRFDVYLTREIDMFIKLDERVRIARGLQCDLFISLHTDSVPPQYAHLNVRGATIYTMGATDGDAKAQKLAEKENLSDVFAGVEALQDEQPDVAGILNDLMRRETSNSSQAFTGTLLEYMKKSTGLSREPHRHAAFKVLRSPDMPSVLVELGYLSNREDEKLLVARDWQDQVAQSIGKAVESYFAKRGARPPY
ncbi:MAG: N-acetylmuramoyl-L-alanine amidase, partial [Vicinamibacterales bacterium]